MFTGSVRYSYQGNGRASYLGCNKNQQTGDQQTMQIQQAIFITEETWRYFLAQTAELKYTGKASYHGVGAWLHAMFEANPTAYQWQDTRPEHLKRFDKYRLENYMPVLWFEDNVLNAGASAADAADEESRERPSRKNAGRRNIADGYYKLIVPYCLDLSIMFDITHPAHKKSNTDRTKHTIAAVLETIGQKYLTPVNPTPICSNPSKFQVAKYRRSLSAKFDLVF